MAHQRTTSTIDGAKEPHSVSLKVLRLSRPSLAIQNPLPLPTPTASPSTKQPIFPASSASLSYPTTSPSNFILSPLLTLPPAFGSAYVGETFSCTLCANNELPPNNTTTPNSPVNTKTITSISLTAEMKIPSTPAPIPLPLSGPLALDSASLQKVLHFDLKEEGSHVLAVTVTYTESIFASPPSTASPDDEEDRQPQTRIRTFRKLYQFICKGCLVVRTKTGPLPSSPAALSSSPSISGETPSTTMEKSKETKKYALEAQLENTTEDNTITLTLVHLETTMGFSAKSLNWEIVVEGKGEDSEVERPVLSPGDIRQVCFLVEEKEVDGTGEDVEGEKGGDGGEGEDNGEVDGEGKEIVDGRLIFGILSIGWRGAMGNKGFLSTGKLGIRVR